MTREFFEDKKSSSKYLTRKWSDSEVMKVFETDKNTPKSLFEYRDLALQNLIFFKKPFYPAYIS